MIRADPWMMIRPLTRSGCVTVNVNPAATCRNGATTAADSPPTASKTASASCAQSSRVGGVAADPRSESPTPLVSNRINRPNDARRRWNRAIAGSSSRQSIGSIHPVNTNRSIGPSPNT
jgi:hypothetical protein